ncbi:transmembrane emp24 domain-containing protein 2, partial [Tribonema minus]
MIDASEELVNDLYTMVDHQTYMRQREQSHRETIDSTNRRLLLWTIAEALLLVSMAMWQVSYIRQFFEVKRMM